MLVEQHAFVACDFLPASRVSSLGGTVRIRRKVTHADQVNGTDTSKQIVELSGTSSAQDSSNTNMQVKQDLKHDQVDLESLSKAPSPAMLLKGLCDAVKGTQILRSCSSTS